MSEVRQGEGGRASKTDNVGANEGGRHPVFQEKRPQPISEGGRSVESKTSRGEDGRIVSKSQKTSQQISNDSGEGGRPSSGSKYQKNA